MEHSQLIFAFYTNGLEAMSSSALEVLIQYFSLETFFKLKMVSKNLRNKLTNDGTSNH
jgi:hypothetical protein